MLLCQAIMLVLWIRTMSCEVLPAVSSSDDISQINNLRSGESPRVIIDPRLRRALLRVLTKLEEEDRNTSNGNTAKEMTYVMQNAISEEDLIKYFQEQLLEQELLKHFENIEPINAGERESMKNVEEILSYSSEDSNKEQAFTFASYPKDDEEEKMLVSKLATDADFQNKEYPSTNPTPALGDPIYFQIPEPIHFQDSEKENQNRELKALRDLQKIRNNLVADLDSEKDIKDIQIPKQESPNEEQKVSFLKIEEPKKETMKDISSKNITIEEQYTVEEENDNLKTQLITEASNMTDIEDSDFLNNSSMKVKQEKHEVEFLHAPLLAAFTVQQDQQGLPRRVIPLNYHSSGDSITLPNNKMQYQINYNENSLTERKQQLEQQIKFLQEQQLQDNQYYRLQEFVRQRQKLLEEEAQRQLELENQKLQYETEQRLALARKRQQQILFSSQHDNNLQSLKNLESQSYYQQQNRIPQNINHQLIHFQKSVDFQYQPNVQQPSNVVHPLNSIQPSFNIYNYPIQAPGELNRVNRNEPSNSIGNVGLSTSIFNFHTSGHPTVQQYQQSIVPNYLQQSNLNHQHRFSQSNNYDSTQHPIPLDAQLQSLLSTSGIARNLETKPSAQEDLNIVSKVLALGHENHQFQASTTYEQVVEPSRVIQPPKL